MLALLKAVSVTFHGRHTKNTRNDYLASLSTSSTRRLSWRPKSFLLLAASEYGPAPWEG